MAGCSGGCSSCTVSVVLVICSLTCEVVGVETVCPLVTGFPLILGLVSSLAATAWLVARDRS